MTGDEKVEGTIWTDERIRWMNDASGKSKFYYWIAERISAYLPPSSRVFNAGGGLGDLAIWLSYHVEQVTVMESDPKAVAAFRARCPQNVVAMLGDISTYSPDRLFDALVLYDIGGAEIVLPLVRELSRAKTFLIFPRESAQEEETIHEVLDLLRDAEIPLTYETFEQEHIQPLRSFEDAKAYFNDCEGRTASDDELNGLLVHGNDIDLPFLYVQKKKLGMIVFNAANPALKKPLL